MKKVARLAPSMKKSLRNLLAQIGSHGVVWIPSTTNVFPLLGDNHGGYGVVRKVQIKKFNHIPSTIELVRKTLKMDDK